MKPVHSSLSVLFVAPFLSAAGHFHGISSSPKSFTLLLLIGAGNKSTRRKAGFVELKTARTDSARQAIFRAIRCGYFLEKVKRSVRASAISSVDRTAPSTAYRRKTRAPAGRVAPWSSAAK